MEINQSVRDRIFAAADAMYAGSEGQSFPTVDAVRKQARVNMNDASAGMKEWRRAQTTTFSPVPVQLPAELQASCISALVALWKEATTLANESLRGAQAGWEAERVETEELSRQLATAYDLQSCELETAQNEATNLKAQVDGIAGDMAKLKAALETSASDRALALAAARESEVKTFEIERRAEELRKELNTARVDVIEGRAKMAALHLTHENQMERVRNEAKQDLKNERDRSERATQESQRTLAAALQEAAELRGRLEATKALLPAGTPKRKRKMPDGDATKPGNGT